MSDRLRFDFPVSLEEWRARDDLPPRDLLLGHLFSRRRAAC